MILETFKMGVIKPIILVFKQENFHCGMQYTITFPVFRFIILKWIFLKEKTIKGLTVFVHLKLYSYFNSLLNLQM